MLNKGFASISRLRGLSPSTARLYGPTFTQQKVDYSKFSKESTVVCVGGPSMQASLLYAIQSAEIKDVTKFAIVGKRSWLIDAHQDWDDKPWGQCKRYLPPPMRQIAEELYGSYPDNTLLSFGMMKLLLIDLERRLAETGIRIIDQEVLEFKETPGGLVGFMRSGEEISFGDTNYKIINAAHIPASFKDMPNNSTGLIYHASKQESFDPIAVIGSGANLSWTCRDFSQIRQIIHIVPPGERIRNDLSDSLYCRIELDDTTEIQKLGNKLVISGINKISGESVIFTVPEDRVYSALGMQHNLSIVSSIDPRKSEIVDCGTSKESIEMRHNASSYKKTHEATIDFRGTVSNQF